LSDPTGIYKLLTNDFSYKGCICLADAVNLPKVYHTARVCKRQLSVSDLVLINKTDLADEEQLQTTRNIIKTQRPDATVFETSFGRVENDWLDMICKQNINNDFSHTADINLHKLSIRVSEDLSLYEFTKFLEMIAEDTYRIKGFVRLSGKGYLTDCVGSLVKVGECIEPVEISNIVNVLYGYGLPTRKSVENAIKWYSGKVTLQVEKNYGIEFT